MGVIIDSGRLRAAAEASERFERAEAAMRRGWPEPSKKVVEEWNAARRAAETACRNIGLRAK